MTTPVLQDARKMPISMRGFALLAWNFEGDLPRRSVQLEEVIVDKILEWRDKAIQEQEIAAAPEGFHLVPDEDLKDRCG